MLLLAAVLWAATTLVIKGSRLAKVSPAKTLFYQLAGSALVLPFVSLALGEPGLIALTPLVLASLAYQTVLVAFASYLAWFWLVATYPAGRLAAFSFLTPIFGVLAGALLLGERISPALAVALGLVALGIWLVNRRRRRREPPRIIRAHVGSRLDPLHLARRRRPLGAGRRCLRPVGTRRLGAAPDQLRHRRAARRRLPRGAAQRHRGAGRRRHGDLDRAGRHPRLLRAGETGAVAALPRRPLRGPRGPRSRRRTTAAAAC
jgi:uncharacterized membrane protein